MRPAGSSFLHCHPHPPRRCLDACERLKFGPGEVSATSAGNPSVRQNDLRHHQHIDVDFGTKDISGTEYESHKRSSGFGSRQNLIYTSHYGTSYRTTAPDFIHIPSSTRGPLPFNFQLALRNRIPWHKLSRDGVYDPDQFPLLFVHDCLQLPGTLAYILGKDSPFDIIQRMTPGVLKGYRVCNHTKALLPCLLPSGGYCVHGMVIVGQGRRAMQSVREHYGARAERVRVRIDLDVMVSVPWEMRARPDQNYMLSRREFTANAWVWKEPGEEMSKGIHGCLEWKLEDYVKGASNDQSGFNVQLDSSLKRGSDGDEK